MVRLSISSAAFDAICATLPRGSVGFEREPEDTSDRVIWIGLALAHQLAELRGPDESYSELILRLAKERNPRIGRVAPRPRIALVHSRE